MFFTCVVGIIELLPEFVYVTGIFGKITISVIYFGLLFGILFSVNHCFWLYDLNLRWGGEYAFVFPTVEFLHVGDRHLTPKHVKRFLIVVFFIVFFALYLVKIGLLQ